MSPRIQNETPPSEWREPKRKARERHGRPSIARMAKGLCASLALALALVLQTGCVIDLTEGESPAIYGSDFQIYDVIGDSDDRQDDEASKGTGATRSSRTLYTANVRESLQLPDLPAGCEEVALACVLRAYGFDATAEELIEEYLPIDPTFTDFVDSYGGDPYTGGGAYPPAIVITADRYFESKDVNAAAEDLTGSSFDDISERVREGQPILVWTTMYMNEPHWSSRTYESEEWYSNEHCVVVYGVHDDAVLVSDPLDGMVRRDLEEFADLYSECGSMAVAIGLR